MIVEQSHPTVRCHGSSAVHTGHPYDCGLTGLDGRYAADRFITAAAAEWQGTLHPSPIGGTIDSASRTKIGYQIPAIGQ